MNELSLYTGPGGGLLASRLLGWNTIAAVEKCEYCWRVLLQRQRDRVLERFPIWDDIRTFDARPFRGYVDIVTGGFPCQDISCAGKGAGIKGERSGLWSEFKRVIKESEPYFAFIENSPLLRTRGLVTILQDLASLGYDARWLVLGAGDLGFIHRRKRMWILAYSQRCQWRKESHCRQIRRVGWEFKPFPQDRDWKSALSSFRRVDNGLARNVGRTDAIRNGQVPLVAATAFNILSKGLM